MGIVHVVYCNLEGKIWLNLNLSCYIQQEAEEAFCILSLSAFEGLVFQKKLQLASNFFSILFSIQIPRNFLFILWKFLIIETRAVLKKE